MIINLATDHAGYELKNYCRDFLTQKGYFVIDHGNTIYDKNDDYPDFVSLASECVSKNPENNLAIVFGGSGEGEAMVANRYKNVRATVFYGNFDAIGKEIIFLSKNHNNANVLSIGARFTTPKDAMMAINMWLQNEFSNESRHKRRIEKF